MNPQQGFLRISAALAAVTCSIALLPAQTPTAPSVSSQTQEVALYLVVTDKHGRTVADLHEGDLAITDSGQPVKLTSLRPAGTGTAPLVTLVFDRLSPSAAAVARGLATRILNNTLDRRDSIAVLAAAGRLSLLADYTADRAPLTHAVDTATRAPQAELEATVATAEKQLLADAQTGPDDTSGRARMLIAAIQESAELVQSQHTAPALSELTALVRAQSKLPGRKAVLYFSQGLSTEMKTRGAIVSVIDEANRAGVSLFPIDVNAIDARTGQRLLSLMGVATPTPSVATPIVASGGAPSLGNTSEIVPQGVSMAAAEHAGRLEFSGHDVTWNWNPLSELAEGTGGIYIGTNPSGSSSAEGTSLEKQLEALHDNLGSYYEATYMPAIERYDGQFRPIAVRTLRHGLVVHTRTGYLALPPAAPASAGLQPELIHVFDHPDLPAPFRFRAAFLALKASDAGTTGAIDLEVPLAELKVQHDDSTGLSAARVVFAAQIRNAHGSIVQSFHQEMISRTDSGTPAPDAAITFARHLTLPAGAYTLETAVQDQAAGTVSAQRAPFSVQPAGSGPGLSDVLVVRGTEPATADPLEPLLYKGSRVVPALAPERSAAAPLSLFFLAAPDPHSAAAPEIRLTLIEDKTLLGESPIPLPEHAGADPFPLMTTLKAGTLAPGSYRAQITLTQGGQSVVRSAEFVLPGAAQPPQADPGALAVGANELAPAAGTAPTATRSALAIDRVDHPLAHPAQQEIDRWLAAARAHALDYSDTLPNFYCVETINRSVDLQGRGDWRHQDSIVELVQYRDRIEHRTPVEINGEQTHTAHENLPGVRSLGEFGGVLRAVLSPAVAASFAWRETDTLDAEPLQVFTYAVPREHSSFSLNGANNRQLVVGYHGLVYLDAATGGVRRVTMEADGLPEDFSISAATISVDYSYVTINAHDYLMPARGSMSLRNGKHRAMLNEFDFRDYRRFGSHIRILTGDDTNQVVQD